MLWAQTDVESDAILYSEIQPLASQSLLLDIAPLGTEGFVAVGERGHILLSSDGKEWQQASGVPTRVLLTSVTVVGDEIWAAGHETVILHSRDRGETWSLQNHDRYREQPVLDIQFFDQESGFAMGAYGLFLVTEDGGENWVDDVVSDEEWHLNGVVDLGGGQWVIAGEAGFSYRTEDAGENWEVVELPYPGSMFGLFRDSNCLIAHGLRGNALHSCDAGVSWEELELGVESSIAGGVAIDGEWIMVGNTGTIVRRDADGRYNTELHSTGVDFSNIINAGQGRFLIVGEGGIHHYPESEGVDQ